MRYRLGNDRAFGDRVWEIRNDAVIQDKRHGGAYVHMFDICRVNKGFWEDVEKIEVNGGWDDAKNG